MIGQQAFIERSVSKKHSLNINNIQTSVVYEQFYPIKAVADHTLCLSSNYAKNFNEAGINNKGTAVFIGTLKYLSSTPISSDNNESLKSILYATQPYEPSLSYELLSELSCWLNTHMQSVTLRVRLHPRDDISNYVLLKNVEIVSNTETISESIKNSSLVLTRTSSVVLDAVGYKIPYIICKLSNFDFKVDLPYLKIPELSVFNCQELISKVSQFNELSRSYKEIILQQENESKELAPTADESIQCFLDLFETKGINIE